MDNPFRYGDIVEGEYFTNRTAELKNRGVSLVEAFNQISRYKEESFWAEEGLFEYVQLFIISNGSLTRYHANTVRSSYIAELNNNSLKSDDVDDGYNPMRYKTFDFTIGWANLKNEPIDDLEDFVHEFLARNKFLEIITKYCVFTANEELIVLRPYQIAAIEGIRNKVIHTHYNKKLLSTPKAGGYIWHTTGSGKTLTSFKAAQLLGVTRDYKGETLVDKVFFVVDRKDLDAQTLREYNKYQPDSVNGNTTTDALKKQIEDDNTPIIVTTIQKLARFIGKHRNHEIYKKRIAIIIDECHRSNFGEMHKRIVHSFLNYNLFGFTGTPIFKENKAVNAENPAGITTEAAFGEQIHCYTILDAIRDKKVLSFQMHYHNTVKTKAEVEGGKVFDINRKEAFHDERRIEKIVEYILEQYPFLTRRKLTLKNNKSHKNTNFNALLATDSIAAAKLYYLAFKKAQEKKPESERLKVALIYTFAANEENENDEFIVLDPANKGDDFSEVDYSSKEFLNMAMQDYNAMFGTQYTVDETGFQNYYKNFGMRLRSADIDLGIVVNMYLTGFDSQALNTLFVDKNLYYHNLIQAYSRTNRICNRLKTEGQIVLFRNLEKETDDAIALFGNKDAKSYIIRPPYKELIKKLKNDVNYLKEKFPEPNKVLLAGNRETEDFIRTMNKILKSQNQMAVFKRFVKENPLQGREAQNYMGIYNTVCEERNKRERDDGDIINDDLVYEVELIKSIAANLDYIIDLIKEYVANKKNFSSMPHRERINTAIDSNPTLRDRKKLILAFVDAITVEKEKNPNSKTDVRKAWGNYLENGINEALSKIIQEETLKSEETKRFMENVFKNGYFPDNDPIIKTLLAVKSRFDPNPENNYIQYKERVIRKLSALFEEYKALL